MRIFPVVSCLYLFFSVATTHAVLIAADSFLVGPTPAVGQYTATQITGQGPTLPGYTGNWLNGNASAVVTASGLSYPGLESSGGALLANSGTTAGSREGRLLSSAITGTTSGTFYMSVLIQLSNATGGNYKAFELHNGGFADSTQRTLQIGQGGTSTDFGGTTNFGLRLFSNNTFRIDLGLADTDVNLFVIRFDLSTTNNADSVTIWRNPSSLLTEPAISNGTLTNFNLTFDRTSVGNFQFNGDSITVDEIRFGDSYTSVLPVPEPSSTLLLILIGSVAGTGRRRRC
jgi:PEP-CTERM motif